MAIRLTVIVDNIDTVMLVYDRIQIQRATNDSMTDAAMLTDLGVVNGNNAYITLNSASDSYIAVDSTGTSENWYQSRYYSSTVSGTVSGWSDPVKGEAGDLFYDPCRAKELTGLSDEEQLVIDEIRRLIGDPLDVRREYGNDAASSIHPDGMTYELDEKGWPICVTMGGEQYVESTNPTINGYRYLIFEDCIDTTEVVCSGSCNNERGVDIWYYTFRWSDREIMEAYDNCPPPPPLTTANATPQAYILYTAKRLLGSENWHDGIEDGAIIKDEGTTYDPSPGLKFRSDLLDDLGKQLDDLVQSLVLRGIEGVRVE
jgi:hypothetical protein